MLAFILLVSSTKVGKEQIMHIILIPAKSVVLVAIASSTLRVSIWECRGYYNTAVFNDFLQAIRGLTHYAQA